MGQELGLSPEGKKVDSEEFDNRALRPTFGPKGDEVTGGCGKLRHDDLGFEVLTAVVMKVDISWDILLCSPYVNRRFGGSYHLHLQGPKSAIQKQFVAGAGHTKRRITYGLQERYIPEDGIMCNDEFQNW
jgi:hypothetical protein